LGPVKSRPFLPRIHTDIDDDEHFDELKQRLRDLLTYSFLMLFFFLVLAPLFLFAIYLAFKANHLLNSNKESYSSREECRDLVAKANHYNFIGFIVGSLFYLTVFILSIFLIVNCETSN
jgi:hypothetical protein